MREFAYKAHSREVWRMRGQERFPQCCHRRGGHQQSSLRYSEIVSYCFAGAALEELVISMVLAFIRFTRCTNTISQAMLAMKNRTTPASTNHGHRKRLRGSSVMATALACDKTGSWPLPESGIVSSRFAEIRTTRASANPRSSSKSPRSDSRREPPAEYLVTHTTMSVGDHHWQLEFSAPLRSFRSAGNAVLPWAALASGLLITVLLSGLVGSLAISPRRAQRSPAGGVASRWSSSAGTRSRRYSPRRPSRSCASSR